jgi:hypothetical protein
MAAISDRLAGRVKGNAEAFFIAKGIMRSSLARRNIPNAKRRARGHRNGMTIRRKRGPHKPGIGEIGLGANPGGGDVPEDQAALPALAKKLFQNRFHRRSRSRRRKQMSQAANT